MDMAAQIIEESVRQLLDVVFVCYPLSWAALLSSPGSEPQAAAFSSTSFLQVRLVRLFAYTHTSISKLSVASDIRSGRWSPPCCSADPACLSARPKKLWYTTSANFQSRRRCQQFVLCDVGHRVSLQTRDDRVDFAKGWLPRRKGKRAGGLLM